MSRVHRLRKQLRVAKDREEKEISKEFVALQKLPSEGAGALEAPAECHLVPEGTVEELEGVFQLPVPSWAEISLVQDDAFWISLPDQVPNDGGGIDPFDFELLFFLWLEVERRLQLDIWVRGFQERYMEYRVYHGVFG
ncbi:hypothetical protein LTR12_016419 [Friedmanniomyces endolithicus]|nr:hypothetical protein LTR12_016419 [Friedmanniomyces endolithicus]